MNDINIEVRKIAVSEYQALRASTDWKQIEDYIIEMALERDLYSICILHHEKVVGIGRVIGDGAIYFYIQDIIVLPKYQEKGIGKIIMENIETYLNVNTNNNSFVGLMAAEGVVDFYAQFGYKERPHNRPGMYKVISKASTSNTYEQ